MVVANPLVSVIILNHNGRDLLPDCIESLKRQTYKPLEIILVDNGSTDNSLPYIEKNFPDVKILKLEGNYGFSGGNNKGVEISKGEYILLLNNDTITTPDLIGKLVSHAQSSGCKAVAPKILMHPSKSIINGVGVCMNRLGFAWDRGIGEKDVGRYDEETDKVFGVSGGCMLFDRDVLKDTELFDERYWMYYEDVDFSWRLRLLNYKSETLPSAIVYHKFRMSMEKRSKGELLFHQEKNRICNLIKNYSFGNMIKYFFSAFFFDSKRGVIALLRGGESARSEALQRFKAYLWNLCNIVETLKRRAKIQKARRVSDSDILKYIEDQVGSHPVVIPDYRVVDRESFRSRRESIFEIVMGEGETSALGPGWSETLKIKDDGKEYTCRKCGEKGIFYLSWRPGLSKLTLLAAPTDCRSVSLEFFANDHPLGKFSLKAGKISSLEFPILSQLTPINDIIECVMVVLPEGTDHIKGRLESRRFFLAVHKAALS